MQIELPDNTDFEVSFESDQKLQSTVLVFSSTHFLLNILTEGNGHHILTEKWENSKGTWTLRRHISLENVPTKDYFYFVFLISSTEQEAKLQMKVKDSEFKTTLNK
jgi:hypothetical protein